MSITALHFASVALNTDPVPEPSQLVVAQKYAILVGQGTNRQKIKSWVRKTTYLRIICLRETVGSHAQLKRRIFDNGRLRLRNMFYMSIITNCIQYLSCLYYLVSAKFINYTLIYIQLVKINLLSFIRLIKLLI